MITMTTDDLKELMNDSATYPFVIEGGVVKFYDEPRDEKPLYEFRLKQSYADEDLEVAIEDLAWWIRNNLDDPVPLIFRNQKLQEKLYKQVQEYKR